MLNLSMRADSTADTKKIQKIKQKINKYIYIHFSPADVRHSISLCVQIIALIPKWTEMDGKKEEENIE